MDRMEELDREAAEKRAADELALGRVCQLLKDGLFGGPDQQELADDLTNRWHVMRFYGSNKDGSPTDWSEHEPFVPWRWRQMAEDRRAREGRQHWLGEEVVIGLTTYQVTSIAVCCDSSEFTLTSQSGRVTRLEYLA